MSDNSLGALKTSGPAVIAYDGPAAQEFCRELPDIKLLILNTEGTGMDLPTLVRSVRKDNPGLSVLHIGATHPANMPADVRTLAESFSPDPLLTTVRDLVSASK